MRPMAVDLLYLRDAYLREFDAVVTAVDADGRRIALDRTAFYPTGGGQPHDTGTLAGLNVTEVRKEGDDVWHTVDAAALPTPGISVHGVVDWDRRHRLMRTHTALHVLCGVIWHEYGKAVTGGNMEPLSARMDFEFDPLPEGFGATIEQRVNEELGAARPIEVQFLPRDTAVQDEDLIRTKVNMIPESVKEIRVIDIVGLDKQADGGTHVRSTDEVGRIRVVKTESKGKAFKRIRIEVVEAIEAIEVADLDRLRQCLAVYDSVVVAFSGGADSAFLAWMANDVLGPERALAVTAVSPSLAPEERADCAALADEWRLNWEAVETDELADPAYSANDGQRCYHCKTSLMDALAPFPGTAVLGVNVDDLGDHRPGQQAAAERGARFPLVDAGFTKADVRAASHALGLRTWDKPAAACLASRVPYGTAVTLGVLSAVAQAESALKALGFRQLRVRHYGDLARIELDGAEVERAVALRSEVVAAVKAAGYQYVTLDLEGFRSGNLNNALGARGAR
jgi:uncharacterized protein (TIGR00268 family)